MGLRTAPILTEDFNEDELEVADDEEDEDIASLFKWRKRTRVMSIAQEKEKSVVDIEENIIGCNQKIFFLKLKLQGAEERQSAGDFKRIKAEIADVEKRLQLLTDRKRRILMQRDVSGIDVYREPDSTQTKFVRPHLKRRMTLEEKWKYQGTYLQENEKLIQRFGLLDDLLETRQFLSDHPKLLCEEAANYLVLWAINLDIQERAERMANVAHQALLMQFILELANRLDTDPRNCFLPIFTRLTTKEETFLAEFNNELFMFIGRIKKRASIRIEEAKKVVEEEERVHRLGPGGLDPVAVYSTLPKLMQKAFDEKDVALLEQAVSTMRPEDADYHMRRCVQSGLWVPENQDPDPGTSVDGPAGMYITSGGYICKVQQKTLKDFERQVPCVTMMEFGGTNRLVPGEDKGTEDTYPALMATASRLSHATGLDRKSSRVNQVSTDPDELPQPFFTAQPSLDHVGQSQQKFTTAQQSMDDMHPQQFFTAKQSLEHLFHSPNPSICLIPPGGNIPVYILHPSVNYMASIEEFFTAPSSKRDMLQFSTPKSSATEVKNVVSQGLVRRQSSVENIGLASGGEGFAAYQGSVHANTGIVLAPSTKQTPSLSGQGQEATTGSLVVVATGDTAVPGQAPAANEATGRGSAVHRQAGSAVHTQSKQPVVNMSLTHGQLPSGLLPSAIQSHAEGATSKQVVQAPQSASPSVMHNQVGRAELMGVADQVGMVDWLGGVKQVGDDVRSSGPPVGVPNTGSRAQAVEDLLDSTALTTINTPPQPQQGQVSVSVRPSAAHGQVGSAINTTGGAVVNTSSAHPSEGHLNSGAVPSHVIEPVPNDTVNSIEAPQQVLHSHMGNHISPAEQLDVQVHTSAAQVTPPTTPSKIMVEPAAHVSVHEQIGSKFIVNEPTALVSMQGSPLPAPDNASQIVVMEPTALVSIQGSAPAAPDNASQIVVMEPTGHVSVHESAPPALGNASEVLENEPTIHTSKHDNIAHDPDTASNIAVIESAGTSAVHNGAPITSSKIIGTEPVAHLSAHPNAEHVIAATDPRANNVTNQLVFFPPDESALQDQATQ